jgi:hypothetical protein
MSDEKRQTRLLPFRLRRAPRAHAREHGEVDFSADAELTALLRTWDAPPRDAGARARLLADFRASVGRPPLWRRALTAQVRVPLPVAACAGLLLLGSLYVLGARATPRAGSSPSQAAAPPPAVRVVEVPVVQERVVTRTVYVEKKERGGPRVVSTRTDAREESARRDDKNEGDEKIQQSVPPAPSAEAQAGYFTRVNMNDFQPAGEVKFRIVSRGGTDEK